MDVRKSPQMREIEQRVGKPIEQALRDAINAQGSVPAAAEALEVNLNTFYGWLRYLRIELRTIAEVPTGQAA